MADIGISYAHVDAALAIAARKAFIERGFSVWMDEAGEPAAEAESIGLPWGQSHWNVITAEFSAANVVVVIDTPAWHQSQYCQAEYRFLRDWGKWIEFVAAGPDGELGVSRLIEISELAIARQSVTSAHARLMEAAWTGGPRNRSRAERLLHRAEERDARLVLASSPRSSGIVVTEQLTQYAKVALRRGRSARKTLSRIAVTCTAVLAVLAVTGVAALAFANAGERSAKLSAARSQALELAAKSRTVIDTTEALALARDAEELSPSRESTEAINIATANDARLRTIEIDPEAYLGATWAPHAQVIVGYVAHTIVALDADTGEQLRSITVDDRIRLGTVAVSRDATLAVFATGESQLLHVADLNSGEVRNTGIPNVRIVTTGDGEDLWWTADTGIYRASFSTLGTSVPQRYPLTAPALAVDVTPTRNLIDYIDASGALRTASYGDGTLTEIDTIPIVPTEPGPETASPTGEALASVAAITDAGSALPASLRRCGDNLFGGIRGRSALKGTSFSIIDGALLTLAQYGSPHTPVCTPDNTAWYTTLMPGGPSIMFGVDAPRLPSGAERNVGVSDPSGTRVAAITNNGRLYHIPATRARGEAAEGALTTLRIGDSNYLIHADGQIVNASSGSVTGSVPVRFNPDSARTVGSYGVIATPDALWRIDAAGQVSESLSLTNLTIYGIRGGADGQTFACVTPSGIMLFDPASGETSAIRIDDHLQTIETPIDADISPDGGAVSFVTDSGRVGTITLAGNEAVAAPQFANDTLPPGARTRLAYVPESGGLVVVPSDGSVRLLDDNLNTTSIAFYGAAVDQLSTVGPWAVLTSETLGTAIYDASTLTVQDWVSPEYALSAATVRVEVADKQLAGISIPDPRTGEQSVRMQIPLPTL